MACEVARRRARHTYREGLVDVLKLYLCRHYLLIANIRHFDFVAHFVRLKNIPEGVQRRDIAAVHLDDDVAQSSQTSRAGVK